MAEGAPDAFKRMLRDHVAPALRALGLTGSGTAYAIPSTVHWALIGFQGSMANTRQQVKFTVNCKVVRKDAWARAYADWHHIGAKPTANVGAGDFEWQARIGQLMPGRNDHWWRLSLADDPALIAAAVVDALKRYALPAMRAEIERTS